MRKLAAAALGLAGLLVVGIIGAVAAQEETGDGPVATDTVETMGKNDFKANSIIFSTLAFHPGDIQVEQGTTVRFTYSDADLSNEPHTVTIVEQGDLPDTFDDVFTCQPCGDALLAHFGGQEPAPDEELEPPVPSQQVVEAGEEGLDAPGDSLFFLPGETVRAEVTASPGTTLYYVCAIHPWMQGSIQVTEEQGPDEETPTPTPTATPSPTPTP